MSLIPDCCWVESGCRKRELTSATAQPWTPNSSIPSQSHIINNVPFDLLDQKQTQKRSGDGGGDGHGDTVWGVKVANIIRIHSTISSNTHIFHLVTGHIFLSPVWKGTKWLSTSTSTHTPTGPHRIQHSRQEG